jgi:hypothetical protein
VKIGRVEPEFCEDEKLQITFYRLYRPQVKYIEGLMYKKDSTEIVLSSVRLSVRYFSADIAPRELKFSTEVRLCVRLKSTVLDFGSVALESKIRALTRTLS